MSAWGFTLDFPKPPKGLSANDRCHWGMKHASTQTVRMLVMSKVRALHVPVLDRARVDVVWVVRDRRRRDTDNVAPLLKAIYDGIAADRGVSARILEDDDPAHMEKPGATIRYVKGATAHFRVTITDIDGDTDLLTGERDE